MTIADSIKSLISQKKSLVQKINDTYSYTIPENTLIQNIISYLNNEEQTDPVDDIDGQISQIKSGRNSLIEYLNSTYNCGIPSGCKLKDIESYIINQINDTETTIRLCSWGGSDLKVSNLRGRGYILINIPGDDGSAKDSLSQYNETNENVGGSLIGDFIHLHNGFYLQQFGVEYQGLTTMPNSRTGAGSRRVYIYYSNSTIGQYWLHTMKHAYMNRFICNQGYHVGFDYAVSYKGGTCSINLIFPRPVCGIETDTNGSYTYDLNKDGAVTNKKYFGYNMVSSNGEINFCRVTVNSLTFQNDGTGVLNITVPENTTLNRRFTNINLTWGEDTIGSIYLHQGPKDICFWLRTGYDHFNLLRNISATSSYTLPYESYKHIQLLEKMKVIDTNNESVEPTEITTSGYAPVIYDYSCSYGANEPYLKSIEPLQ